MVYDGGDVSVSIAAGSIKTADLGSSSVLQIPAENLAGSITSSQLAGSITADKLAGSITDTYLDASVIKHADVSLSNAQCLALATTPISVLAQPASGYANICLGIVALCSPGSTPFTETTAGISFKYTDASGDKVSSDLPNAFVVSATAANYYAIPAAVIPIRAAIVASAGATVGAGDGTMKFRIYYRTVSLTLA